VHGYSDYLFNTELAERYNSRGFDFYAIDLRTYGRSLRPHQTPYVALSMDEYFEELDAAIDRIRKRDGHTFLLYNGHSTGGLTGSLYADARRDAGTIDAVFLNLPYFDLNASWLCPGAHVDEGDIPPVDLGDAVRAARRSVPRTSASRNRWPKSQPAPGSSRPARLARHPSPDSFHEGATASRSAACWTLLISTRVDVSSDVSVIRVALAAGA
jgi:alpha-beta hydrolase superfamily lysophospholipase